MVGADGDDDFRLHTRLSVNLSVCLLPTLLSGSSGFGLGKSEKNSQSQLSLGDPFL